MIHLRRSYWASRPIPLATSEPFLASLRLEATDPRDKVYGILSLLDHVTLCTDYSKSVPQVYSDATRALIRDSPGDYLHLLRWCRLLKAPDRTVGNWPSWTLDFSYTECLWASHLDGRLEPKLSTENLNLRFQNHGLDSKQTYLGSSVFTVDKVKHVIVCSYASFPSYDDFRFANDWLEYLAKTRKAYSAGAVAAKAWIPHHRDTLF